MKEQLEKIIAENLPQQVGETLRKRLEQADRDANEVKALKAEKERLEKNIKEFEQELKTYIQFDQRNSELEAREIAVKELERNQKIKDLEYQLSAEKDKTETIKSITLGLVRNTEYRKSIFDSETSGQPVADVHGTVHYPAPTYKSHLTSETIL